MVVAASTAVAAAAEEARRLLRVGALGSGRRQGLADIAHHVIGCREREREREREIETRQRV